MFAIAGAVLAAIAYGAATILQAIGVRRLRGVPAGAPVAVRCRAGGPYAVGLALDGAGFLLSFAALRSLPLFLVESMLASSVGVTAVLAVLVLDIRLAAREVIALAGAGTGLVLLAISAHAGAGRALGVRGGWLLVAGAALVALIFAAGLADRQASRSSTTLAVAGGLGFGLTGIVARVLRPADPWWQTVGRPELWALVVAGAIAIVAYGFALDRGRTTTVAAITFAVETVIPAAVGLALLGDEVRPGFAVVASLGFVVTLGGCLALAGRAEVD